MSLLSQVPFLTEAVQRDKTISQYWSRWLDQLRTRINLCPERIGTVSLTTQAASISVTDVPTPTLHTGLYRISYYARITRAATTSSSLTVSVGWTDRTASCSESGAALTGNTTATAQSGTFFLQVDSASAVTYATTYASSGGTTMQYALDVTVEEVRP
jgi:hypothetical protein